MDIRKHEFLYAYLEYVQQTESSKLLHIWAAIAAVSACLGRRCWYTHGISKIWPNMYIVFSGPPAARKSTAITVARNLLKGAANIRFAPDDTGGQRQGLIAALTDIGQEGDEQVNVQELLSQLSSKHETLSGMATNGHKHSLMAALDKIHFDTRDPHSMYIFASELMSFLGENNSQMFAFLHKMWDGEEYTYKLRTSSYKITDGLLGMIGATTPTDLQLMLPPTAMGSGFTSRIIFVYAPVAPEKIYRATFNKTKEKFLRDHFAMLFDRYEGEFFMTPAAEEVDKHIYMYRGTDIKDPRLAHYVQRRQTHMQKVALCLAAMRGQQLIDDIDITVADELLMMTEQEMPDALGEFGINKETAAKQKLLEYLRACEKPTPVAVLRQWMMRDFSRVVDFENALNEFVTANKVRYVTIQTLGQCVIAISEQAVRKARQQMNEITNLLRKKEL